MDYIKPELLILVPVLFCVGLALKKWQGLQDKYIPITLGTVAIVLAAVYVLATSTLTSVQDVLMAVFVGITQGILCAGASVYADQTIFKQPKKGD